MTILSFAIAMAFYFWIGPLGIVFLLRWLLIKKSVRHTILSLICIGALSWCVTALLAYCVWHWMPGVLPDNVLHVAFCYGWIYLFVTSIPALVLFVLAIFVTQASKKRLLLGCIFASMPYIVILCWGIIHFCE